MECRQCGTEIAEKAILCFKCGVPTTERRVAPPPAPRRRMRLPLIGAAVAAGALLLAAWEAGLLPW